jgi:hypothetical protein
MPTIWPGPGEWVTRQGISFQICSQPDADPGLPDSTLATVLRDEHAPVASVGHQESGVLGYRRKRSLN